MIGPFTGEYRWLSNFSHHDIVVHAHSYPTVEHFYQASKAATMDGYQLVMAATTPGEAKRAGRRVAVRPDFEAKKRAFMMQGVLAKFTQHDDLREKLVATGDERLAEVNTWGDTYWGEVWADGQAEGSGYVHGENWLGRILMMTRELLA
jgi:hypothetical protein